MWLLVGKNAEKKLIDINLVAESKLFLELNNVVTKSLFMLVTYKIAIFNLGLR